MLDQFSTPLPLFKAHALPAVPANIRVRFLGGSNPGRGTLTGNPRALACFGKRWRLREASVYAHATIGFRATACAIGGLE